ncbi:uncharacterized protein LOC143235865 isoform X1 [Tachypleus tridentatus]|uniref:uncharacterized protein LOC143235865 isoform X1 n=1 Tax=Tachypleus tridentatus TaxID=6853 RepID=UPI003FD3365F
MIMEVLNMKVEPFYDEEQEDLDIKLEKIQDDNFTVAHASVKANYVEERSLQTVLKVDMIKDEKEDNYDGSIVKTEVICRLKLLSFCYLIYVGVIVSFLPFLTFS